MVNQVRMNKNFISLLVGIALLATNQIIKKYYSIPDFLLNNERQVKEDSDYSCQKIRLGKKELYIYSY